MYLHLGSGALVEKKSIVGIFDLDNTSQSHLTRKYLNIADKSGQVINVAEDIPKSFIVCRDENGMRIYLSQMSTQTLLKRNSSDFVF